MQLMEEAMFAVVKPWWTAGLFSQGVGLDDGAWCGEGPETLRKWRGKLERVGWVWWAKGALRRKQPC